MKRKFFGAVAGCILALSATTCDASSAGTGYVKGLVSLSNGVVLFFHSGARNGTPPSCENSGLAGRWGINVNSAAGQAMLSVILSAQAQNTPITIDGTGDCSAGANSESVSLIVTNGVQ